MPPPTSEKWVEISQRFENVANFPNCIGALDGKHVRIEKPTRSGSLFYNYKDYFSNVLMAICDADYCFIYVDVGSYGGNCDANVFRNCQFWDRMNEGTLEIPGPKSLPGTNGPALPHVIVADEGFGLSDHIMRPYAKKKTLLIKRKFLTTD